MTYLAAQSGGSALFEALGLNLSALLFNAAAFLVFAWLLGKFVFPHLTRALDAKREEILSTSRLHDEAEAQLHQAAERAEKVLVTARQRADQAIAAAEAQAANVIAEARTKAEAEAKRIIDEAHIQLQQEVAAARLELRGELAHLVAAETEALLGKKFSASFDAKLISTQLEQAS